MKRFYRNYLFYFLLFALSFSTSYGGSLVQSIEKARSSSSQALYNLSNKECHFKESEVINNSNKLLSVLPNCDVKKSFHDDKLSAEDISENAFFNWAANEHISELECRNKSIVSVLKNKKFLTTVVEDINQKLSSLRKADYCIKKLAQSTATLAMASGILVSDQASQIKCESKNLADWHSQKVNIITSVWQGNHPIMSQWLQSLAQKENALATIKDLEIKAAEVRSSNKDSIEEIRKQGTSSKKGLLQSSDFHFETKKAFLQDPTLFEKFEDLDKNNQVNLSELKCRLIGKYSKGDDQLDMALMASSFVVGGGASAVFSKVAPQIFKGVASSLNSLKITSESAKMVLYTSAMIGSPSFIRQLDQDCISERPDILSKGKRSCDLTSENEIVNFEYASLEERNCILNATTNLVPVLAPLGLYLKNYRNLSKANLALEERAGELSNVRRVEDAVASEADELHQRWDPIIKKYKNKEVTSLEENSEFSEYARKILHGDQKNQKEQLSAILDIENHDLKNLNKKLPKDLVTSLNHKFFDQIKTRFKQYEKDNSGLKVYFYSDYKSSRIALSGAKNKKEQLKLQQDLEKIYNEELDKYLNEIKENKILRSDSKNSDQVENWFKASVCDNPGVGNLATRSNRFLKMSFSNCHDSKIEGHLINLKNQVASDRNRFESKFGNSDLMSSVPGTNKKVFSTDVTQFARKSENSNELYEKLKYYYPNVNITQEDAIKIKDHISKIDSFSPPTYQLKRELSVIDDTATEGAFTLDFVGQGGRNIRSTAESLAKAEDNKSLSYIASLADKNLENETEILTRDRSVLEQLTGNRFKKICSGDDCEGVPDFNWSRKERVEFAAKVRNKFELPTRATFSTGKNVDGFTRKNILADGEELEKKFISNLEKVITSEQLKKLDFQIEMDGKKILDGNVDLILSPTNDSNFKTKPFVNKISETFEKTLKEMHYVYENKYPGVQREYQMGQVIAY